MDYCPARSRVHAPDLATSECRRVIRRIIAKGHALLIRIFCSAGCWHKHNHFSLFGGCSLNDWLGFYSIVVERFTSDIVLSVLVRIFSRNCPRNGLQTCLLAISWDTCTYSVVEDLGKASSSGPLLTQFRLANPETPVGEAFSLLWR